MKLLGISQSKVTTDHFSLSGEVSRLNESGVKSLTVLDSETGHIQCRHLYHEVENSNVGGQLGLERCSPCLV